MQRYDKNSWKSKIDPAFDRPIKAYVALLDELARSKNEGQLRLPEHVRKIFLYPENWISPELRDDQSDFFKSLEDALLTDNNTIENTLNLFNSLDNPKKLLKISPSLIDAIPEEESRAFYTSPLEHFSQVPIHELQGGLSDSTSRDFFSVVFSLMLRYLFEALQGDEIEQAEEGVDHFMNPGTLATFLNFFISTFSQIANQRNLSHLTEEIKNGDDEALFKAVKVDKRLLYNEDVRNRILESQLTGDTGFFNKLGKAIAKNPLEDIGEHGKTYAVLQTFWFAGLYKLTAEELHDFLESCGLIPPSYPDAFYKFLQRYVHPTFKT